MPKYLVVSFCSSSSLLIKGLIRILLLSLFFVNAEYEKVRFFDIYCEFVCFKPIRDVV